MKDKESNDKEISELKQCNKEQAEQISELSNRSQMHHGNF